VPYRSKYEAQLAKTLPKSFQYEACALPYSLQHTYTPDWVCVETKTLIEAKGRLTAGDRRKMLAVKAAHPEWHIVMLFQEPNRTLTKRSKTTYRQWAVKHGFAVDMKQTPLRKFELDLLSATPRR
jgi:hypothetical protein